MMKRYLLTTVLLMGFFGAFSQGIPEKCGTDRVMAERLKDPEVRAQHEAFQESVRRYTQNPNIPVIRENGIRIIPVVFHILSDGGAENITKARCETQIEVLNQDFQRLNPDTVNTPARFYGDTEYTHFVFTSDAIEGFIDDSAYVKLQNRYGTTVAFHFNNGTTTLAPTIAATFDEVIEVSISNNSDTAEIAMALASAINGAPGMTSGYSYVDGQHQVGVSNDGLGYADDALLAGLWHITANVDQQGKYLPADCNIEFRLATKDPLGNCTDGIVRVFTSKTNQASEGTGFKATSYWNAYSYLNIWTVASIFSNNPPFSTLGYAYKPATALLSVDGLTVVASTVNTATNGGRTATHEVGHFLNLDHTWGGAQGEVVCGSDNVLDTPVAAQANFGVCGNLGQPFNTQPFNYPGCDPENPDGEMFNNYMDYSDAECQNMYTLGQKARMDFTLEGDGTTPGIRGYLVSQENVEATGVADPYVQPDCAPISGFYFDQGTDFATQKMICVGDEVRFFENSYNGDVDEFAWTFPGGTPASSNDEQPDIDYNTPGVYDVTLQVSNAVGDDSQTVEDMIVVSSTTAQYQSSWGYVESFWDEASFDEDYFVFNQDGTDNKWEWYYGEDGGSTGWESVRMFNMDNPGGEIDELISPSYNFSSLTDATLQFKYSGASVDNTPADGLRIMLSDNCGESWQTRKEMSGFELTNNGLVSTSYRPSANSIWTTVSVALGSYSSDDNVRIKFRWTSGERSNNFYIDDITVSGSPIGMEDLEDLIDFNIAPNPTDGSTSVIMSLAEQAHVTIDLVDVLGRDVQKLMSRELTNGTHKLDVDLSSFNTGVYFLRVAVDQHMLMKKVVKN